MFGTRVGWCTASETLNFSSLAAPRGQRMELTCPIPVAGRRSMPRHCPQRRRRVGIMHLMLPLFVSMKRLVARRASGASQLTKPFVPAASLNSQRQDSWMQRPGVARRYGPADTKSAARPRSANLSRRAYLDLPVMFAAGFAIVCLLVAVPAETWASVGAAAMVTGSVVTPDFAAVLAKASASALKGGIAGFFAGQAQVLAFMWLRTTMNFQYANGGNFQSALKALWEDGGIPRLYKGLWLAILQAPLVRFGDTAANAGILVIMDYYFPELPLAVKTAAGSTMAAFWRVFLMPLDSLKTNLQVNGSEAVDILKTRVRERGLGELYAGALANFAASWAGNYPYFAVFNSLSEAWATPEDSAGRIIRNGIMGMCASTASDITSNSLRVLKTKRQSARTTDDVGYGEAANSIIKTEGISGFLFRGLETRILVNILQGSFFAILWKLIEERINFD
mmetsp:Transcript_58829/g.137392  ORF Transcript_58829/g.137392 Transcript_58829/m.137392 type:complete len:451 (+) Transcript_58829:3-1355(+)